MGMRAVQLQRVMQLSKYMNDLYRDMETLDDSDFFKQAELSIWPNCLYKMHKGKMIPEILGEISSPMELLIILNKLDELKLKENKGA